jgi:hypothetical protein
MNIVVWLRSLGLGQYEAAFRDNEIDEAVLPSLTAEDLKELGVSIVGHRRKLLDAIALYEQMRAPRLHPLMQRPLPARRPSPPKTAPSAVR